MSELQTITDIVVIVGVGLFVLFVLGLIVSALVIKQKINKAQRSIKGKFNLAKHAPYIGGEIFKAAFKAMRND